MSLTQTSVFNTNISLIQTSLYNLDYVILQSLSDSINSNLFQINSNGEFYTLEYTTLLISNFFRKQMIYASCYVIVQALERICTQLGNQLKEVPYDKL